MKIKLFTHTDLDGYGNYIVLRNYFKKEEISIENCNYGYINDSVKKFLAKKELNDYDYIFITDISVSEEVAAEIDSLIKAGIKPKVKLLDHHPTSLHLNRFDFCKVMIEDENELICGTKLFYRYLTEDLEFNRNKTLEEFVKIVNDYDTWLWNTKYHYELPSLWNQLFFITDRETFVEDVLEKIKIGDISFNEMDKKLLKLDNFKKDAYIKKRMKEVFFREIGGESCAIIFATQYLSELATKMAETYPFASVQILIGQDGISFRCRDQESDLDVSKIAKLFGGGGHPKASGATITEEKKNAIMDILFS